MLRFISQRRESNFSHGCCWSDCHVWALTVIFTACTRPADSDNCAATSTPARRSYCACHWTDRNSTLLHSGALSVAVEIESRRKAMHVCPSQDMGETVLRITRSWFTCWRDASDSRRMCRLQPKHVSRWLTISSSRDGFRAGLISHAPARNRMLMAHCSATGSQDGIHSKASLTCFSQVLCPVHPWQESRSINSSLRPLFCSLSPLLSPLTHSYSQPQQQHNTTQHNNMAYLCGLHIHFPLRKYFRRTARKVFNRPTPTTKGVYSANIDIPGISESIMIEEGTQRTKVRLGPYTGKPFEIFY